MAVLGPFFRLIVGRGVELDVREEHDKSGLATDDLWQSGSLMGQILARDSEIPRGIHHCEHCANMKVK